MTVHAFKQYYCNQKTIASMWSVTKLTEFSNTNQDDSLIQKLITNNMLQTVHCFSHAQIRVAHGEQLIEW